DVPSAGLAAGRTVLALEDVSVCFPGAGRPILENVSLRIIGPERVALVGPNGSGKTTLLRVVLGELNPSSGRVRTLPRSEIGFLEQTGAQLDPSLSVLDNFRARHPTMEPTPTRYALARFLFSHEAALQIVGTLSGGERLRASLACVQARGPRLSGGSVSRRLTSTSMHCIRWRVRCAATMGPCWSSVTIGISWMRSASTGGSGSRDSRRPQDTVVRLDAGARSDDVLAPSTFRPASCFSRRASRTSITAPRWLIAPAVRNRRSARATPSRVVPSSAASCCWVRGMR